MRDNKIYLPTLKRVRISNYSLYNQDIDYEFVKGLNLIIGGNGVGKTTFISIIKYALIGLYKKDLDVKNYKGEKRLVRGSYTNGNTFFRNRTTESEKDKTGFVELWFDINETLFYVKRSLYDIKIVAASYIKGGIKHQIEGQAIKQELYKAYEDTEGGVDNGHNLQYNYEKIVAKESNLADFEDFIFFVNQILLFGESRETVLWSKKVQERLLSNFLNDAILEKRRKQFSMEAKYQDSIARHKQEEIKAIVRVLKQIDGAENNPNDYFKNNKLAIMAEIEQLDKVKAQIEISRRELQNKIEALYKQLTELSHKINEREKEKETVESKIRSEFWPGINPKYAIYKRQFIGNHICPICNADLEGKQLDDSVDKCFFCNSKIVYDESKSVELEEVKMALEKLIKERQEIEKRIIRYEQELKRYDSEFRNAKVKLFNKENEIRALESSKDGATKMESSYMAMMNRIDELTIEKENASKQSEENQVECEKIMRNIEENMLDITRSISNIFSDFAEAFMKVPCYLTLDEIDKSKMKLFLPVIDGKVRYDQEELSESQRFFVDYSYRMSLLSFFYECPSFYICETPDSSLDISYEENAADIFMKYLERPNTLILTSNLNNSTFIKSVLSKATTKKVLNLLKFGKISDVQKNHEMLNVLSKEIEEMCNE